MARPRIFISHKVLDKKLVFYVRDELLALGMRADEIYLSEETKPGSQWPPTLLQALTISDILVFIYTDPSYDWDWCLFECGYFAALPPVNGQNRSLVCINSGIGRPSPLDMWQDVSSNQALETFLKSLAIKLESPLLDRLDAFRTYVDKLWTSIYRRLPLKEPAMPEAFKQRRLVIIVPPGEMEIVKAGGGLTDDTQVEMSDGSRSIFPNAPLEAGWDQFKLAIRDQPLQVAWMGSIPVMVRLLNGVRTHSPMLPLIRDKLTSHVAYRPSVAQRDKFGDGSVRYTIVFIRTPESTVASTEAADRLHLWLVLGRYFREAVIETYAGKLKTLKSVEDLLIWTKDLEGEITLAQIDALSRGMDLNSDKELFCKVSRAAIDRITEEWELAINEFEQLQVNVTGNFVIAQQKKAVSGVEFFANNVQTIIPKAQECLSKMRNINAEFMMHILAALLGNVVKPAV